MDNPTTPILNTHVETPPVKRPWVMWLLFCFQFAAVGVFFTFINVYFKQAGLSGTQIGLIGTTTALVSMISAVFWGNLSDRTGQSRRVIAVGALGAVALTQLFPLARGFGPLFALACASSLMVAAPNTLVDSTVLTLLGARREDYGDYRLGGTVGYIITGFGSGFLFARLNLTWIFPIYGVIMVAFAITALLLPGTPIRLRAKSGSALAEMVRMPAWILFTVCVFLCWMASNAAISFMGVSLNAMGASKPLIGIASTIGAVTELPFMFFSGRLLRRFGGTRLLLVSMALMVARFTLLGLMPAPEWAVAINLLNGPAYVFFWNSAVTYVNRVAPPAMAGTAQGLLSSTLALAGMVSSLLSGWLFDRIGPTGIFLVMAGFCVLALALFGFGNLRRGPTAASR